MGVPLVVYFLILRFALTLLRRLFLLAARHSEQDSLCSRSAASVLHFLNRLRFSLFVAISHLLLAQQNGMRSRWSLNGNEWHALVALAEWHSATLSSLLDCVAIKCH